MSFRLDHCALVPQQAEVVFVLIDEGQYHQAWVTSEDGKSFGLRLRSSAGEPEEDENRSAESDHLLVAQPSDPLAKFRARNCCDLVDNQAAGLSKPVDVVFLDEEPEQRCPRRVGRERTRGAPAARR